MATGNVKKAVLITGCDTGFGHSLALHLAENHPNWLTFACCFDSNSEGAKALRQKEGLVVFQVDVTSRKSVDDLQKAVKATLDHEKAQLFVLANNAATLVFADAIWQKE